MKMPCPPHFSKLHSQLALEHIMSPYHWTPENVVLEGVELGLQPTASATQAARRPRRRRRRAVAPPPEGDADGLGDERGWEGGDEGQGSDAEPQPGFEAVQLSAYERKRLEREAAREAFEAAQDAEIQRAREERLIREEEEAQQWRKLIQVEEEGLEGGEEAAAEQQRLFVEAIKQRKMVVLEELAADFGLRSEVVVARIRELEAEGQLVGVMDDRGKYIYLTEDEMEAVASLITERGRISLRQLAAEASSLVSLVGTDAPDPNLSIDALVA